MAADRIEHLLDVIIALTKKELKAKYKSTTLGFFWTLVNPIVQMVVLTIVFTFFFKITVPHFPLFVFAGLLPWVFFSLSIQSGTGSLVANRDIIKKIPFQKELIPVSSVSAHLVMFCFSIPLLVLWSIFVFGFSFEILLLIPLVILQACLAIGISFLLSSLDIYYRDVSFALSAIIIPWFYLTPILYPLSSVPKDYALLYIINPLVGIISSYQAILIDMKYFDGPALYSSILITILVLIFGYILFKKRSMYFAEWV